MAWTFQSELKGVSEDVFTKPLKQKNLKQTKRTNRDVQILFDENYINHIFAYLFESKQEYSIRDFIMSRLTRSVKGAFYDNLPIIEVGVTQALSEKIPGMKKGVKAIDLKCNFNRGNLEEFLPKVKANELNF